MNKEFYIVLISLGVGVGYWSPLAVAAKSVSITNDVSVSALSGGNVAKREEVRTHDSSGHIRVETKVEGRIVEQIDERVVSQEKKPAELKKESFYEDKEKKIKVQTKAYLKADPPRGSKASALQAENVPNIEKGENRSWRQRVFFFLSSLFRKPFHGLTIF
ncbi:MAG: hypothetical protein AAB567_00845 [Patescibacteria group bacterium]